VARSDGSIGFGDLSSASVTDSPADQLHDRAQALVVALLLVGEAAAAAMGRHELGDEGLREVLPYLQEAAMPPLVRERLAADDIELDEVRVRLGAALGAPEQPLVKLRRVTWGSVLNLALLALAAFALIGLFSGLDLDTFADELADARWWWLAFALLLSQLARIPSAVSTMGSGMTIRLQGRGPLSTPSVWPRCARPRCRWRREHRMAASPTNRSKSVHPWGVMPTHPSRGLPGWRRASVSRAAPDQEGFRR
jgi:hypothetical protein